METSIDNLENNVFNNYLLKTETAADTNKSYGYDLDGLKALMLDLAHPIGSYYWSKKADDPSTLFGGTWEQVKDKFILAAGDSYEVDAIGGEVEHTLTETELPKLSGSEELRAWASGALQLNVSGIMSRTQTSNSQDNVSSSGTTKAATWKTTISFGGDQPHNNMPPYLVAYCWYRTA